MLRVPCYERGQSKKTAPPRRHGPGGKTITRLSFRKLACVLAPVVLTGCGAPVGFQIASVLADGVSLLTTDKTLTDHGLSALAEKDCAVLRGLKGKEICRDAKFDATAVADLEISPPAGEPDMESDMEDSAIPQTRPAQTRLAQAGPAPSLWIPPGSQLGNPPGNPLGNQPGGAKTASLMESPAESPAPLFAKVETASLPEIRAPAPKAPQSRETGEAPKAKSPAGSDLDAPVDTPVAAPVPAEPAKPAETAAEVKGGTFYVLASYRRLANAKQFARTQAKWLPKILSGTASGRHVYRVAVGPVDRAWAFQLKARLKRDGLKDAWALKLAKPKIARDLASLD